LEVLCVYREVTALRQSEAFQPNVAIISHDEKPGIQAIGNTAPPGRRNRGLTRVGRGIMNTSAMAR
jgi:hypothetical protein